MKMDYRQICKNEEISLLIEKGNEILHELGYTEHSRKHAMKVAEGVGIRQTEDRAGKDRRIYA